MKIILKKGLMMWIKLKCPECGREFQLMLLKEISEEEMEKAKICPCGEEMEVVGEEDG